MGCEILFLQPDGKVVVVDCEPGQSLMTAAIANGVDGIIAECGGCCACGTCHVYVQEDRVSALAPASPDENDILDNVSAGRRPGSRLSCQIQIVPSMNGIAVEIPESQF